MSNKAYIWSLFLIVLVFVALVGGLSGFGERTAFAQDAVGVVQAEPDRAVLLRSFVEAYSGGTVALEEATGQVKEFVLEVREIESEIAPGVTVSQWAFAFPGEEPSVPGPEIRVTQGDLVRITLRNTHTQPHTIHPHGIISVAQEMDGVEATSHQVLPGEEYSYEFVAANVGTHAYHCHVQTDVHLDMGMYGAIIVEPQDKSAVVWEREYSLTLDEWDAQQNPLAVKHETEPTYFLINGKAAPLTETFEVPEGELALFRITNVGYEPHSLHLHGLSFLTLAKDGFDLPAPYRGDTLPIMPGERYDILVKGRDGAFPFHDHVVSNVTNDGVYPGGMLTVITGGEPRSVTDSPLSVYYDKEAAPQKMSTAHSETTAAATPVSRPSASGASASDLYALAPEDDIHIDIETFAFSQEVVRVKAGTTITWTNRDVAPHTVTEGLPGEPAAERVFDSSLAASGESSLLAQGESWSYTFSAPGEYDYYCLPHPFMTAKVVVE